MFVHLHSHSEYSIGDGLFDPKKWAKAYKERGFKAAALTDHGTMGGVLPFYHAMRAEGLTPIIGVEAYFNFNPTVKDSTTRKNCHLVLLARNYEGVQNLYRLMKLSYTEGYYYRPRIGYEWLKKYRDNLICLSACTGGPLALAVRQDMEAGDIGLYPRLHDTYRDFHNIFGDNFYVEMQGHNFDGQVVLNNALYQELIVGEKAKPIITNDNHYILPEHAKVQAVLKAAVYANAEAAKSYTECNSLWLKKPEDIVESFKEFHPAIPDAVLSAGMENTEEIFVKTMKMRLPEGEVYLPKFRPHIDSKDLFKKITTTKLKSYLTASGLSPKDYIERFKKEFKVIAKYKLEDYFLIVWDLVRFADKHNIYVGLGRGSAAGCLISYLMGIVRIDPIKFDLIFERFLNEVRCETGELPDIDLDFESDSRQLIKNYIVETYGEEFVCEIGTYGRMKLKTSLIDFAKAMEVASHREILNITTTLDTEDFEEALEECPALKTLCLKNIEYVNAVECISGQIKSQAIHPAGMIISPHPIETLTPLKTLKVKKEEAKVSGKDRALTTQCEDKHVLSQGLMKVDVLGVKQYDIVKYVLENSDCPLTRENYVEEIDYGDKKVWKMFQNGETDGVFQFSSDGMKQLLINMYPTDMGDLIAANALYRPGCLRNGWHDDYCNRKNGKESVTYMHPIVEEITKDTYGILVYQEQVMAIINKLGGIDLAESDIIRSALGKKNEEKLKKYGPKFIDGASKHIGEDKAEKLWKQIMHSSEYSFNKSHSASYSVLAYVSQWLKCYYKAHFWAAVCDWDARKNKIPEMISNIGEAKRNGVNFTLPNINRSKKNFFVVEEEELIKTIKTKEVVMPFTVVKGLGEKSAIELEKHAPFTDFKDFLARVNKSKVKINNIIAMIGAGVMDSFGDKKELLETIYDSRTEKQLAKMTPICEINFNLMFYESMGFFEQKIKSMAKFDFCDDIFLASEVVGTPDGDYVRVGGMITEIRKRKTKHGDNMAFVRLVDNDEVIQLTIFADAWGSHSSKIKENSIVEVGGTKSSFGGAQNQVQVEDVRYLGEL